MGRGGKGGRDLRRTKKAKGEDLRAGKGGNDLRGGRAGKRTLRGKRGETIRGGGREKS